MEISVKNKTIKKLAGWSIVLFCYFTFLVLALVTLVNLTEEKYFNDRKALLEVLSSYVIVVVVFIFLYRFGKKLIKDNSIKTIPYLEPLSIHVRGTTTYVDYRNVMVGMLLRSTGYQVFLLFPVMVVFLYFMTENVNVALVIISLIFLFFLSLFTFRNIKKTYHSTKLFNSETEYYITQDSLRIKGEEVDSTTKWNFYIRTKETKHFILLYQSPLLAALINKKFFSTEELTAFQKFLNSLPIPHN